MSSAPVSLDSVWITGSTRSGKTTRLIRQLGAWAAVPSAHRTDSPALFQMPPMMLVLAAVGDNRLDLVDRIAAETASPIQFDSATPLGFFQKEVTLFYPLLARQLSLKATFPLRLRPETEQQYATQLWRSHFDRARFQWEGISEYFLVRRTLDLLQLAAASGTPHEEITAILQAGIPAPEGTPELWETLGEAIALWIPWCLERGLLTYGILTELYWRYLLPHPTYQQNLKQRYRAVLADDVDEYPAVARSLFEVFQAQGIPIACTYNPNGGTRLGLGADPAHLAGLAAACPQHETTQAPDYSLGAAWGDSIATWMQNPLILPQLPDTVQTVQTTSRAELLRQTAETIAAAVQAGQVQPQDIAIIGAGVDPIARYTLREILTRRGIPIRTLNDQYPLVSSPLIRALLTLLALVYPGLGRLVDREAVAAMLVLLSQSGGVSGGVEAWRQGSIAAWTGDFSTSLPSHSPMPQIDPVRAGLIVDHCFVPDPEAPQLLPVTAFPRWDRLGFQATQAYEGLLQWLNNQREQQQQHLLPNPVALLDRAIQRFFYGGSQLPYDQLSALRELMETAQHYWSADQRLRQVEATNPERTAQAPASQSETVGQFIRLLLDGTITANPYPVRPIGKASEAVIMATIYQYRLERCAHRWQFWLDAGSPFWLTGGGALFGSPLFLRKWSGQRQWTAEDTLTMDEQRLQRQVIDLLHRAKERVYLCHSDLAASGQEQTGSLLSLVNAAIPLGG
ncbi:recombinase family protein [Phormidium tenue FACHB-886]|nr:recombinase family protein [Phormidium tenue FACHB-886]